MFAPARSPDDHFQHWLSTSLNESSCRDFILTCRLEIELLRYQEQQNDGSAGLMPATWNALTGFLEQKPAAAALEFSEVKNALAVKHIEPFVTVISDKSDSSVLQAFEGRSNAAAEDSFAGMLRSVDILTALEIVGEHFIEIAALQLNEKEELRAYLSAYKGVPMAPCLQNAWFFANGVVRANYAAEFLALKAPRSPLLAHKRQLLVHFFDSLNDCVSLSCQGEPERIAQAMRENISASARFLGYPETRA